MDRPSVTVDTGRYRQRLEAHRVELIADLCLLEDEAREAAGPATPSIPMHLADHASDTCEHDSVRAMADRARTRLHDIDAALDRIQRGTFGICEVTGESIPVERLDSTPWARCTVDAARRLEQAT